MQWSYGAVALCPPLRKGVGSVELSAARWWIYISMPCMWGDKPYQVNNFGLRACDIQVRIS
jgi:hypothetical protein